MTPGDWPICSHILEMEGIDPGLFPPKKTCFKLLGEDGIAIIIEDTRPERPEPALMFGFTAFLNPAMTPSRASLIAADELQRCIRKLMAGEGFLTQDEIASHNSAGGLSLFFFGGRAHRIITPEDLDELSRFAYLAHLHVHRGFNAQEFRALSFGIEHLQHLLSSGMRPFGSIDGSPPYLLGLTREEARKNPGTFFDILFGYCPPVLRLSANERELSTLALTGMSDQEISVRLGVSLDAVKKRWRTLFESVATNAPQLLPAASLNGARGPTKRLILLDYLRAHPEELRPHFTL